MTTALTPAAARTMIYTVDLGNGQVAEVEGPENASSEQLQQVVQSQQNGAAQPTSDPSAPTEAQFGDDPDRVSSRMTPEQEAQAVQIHKTGTLADLAAFYHSIGRPITDHLADEQAYFAARDKGERVDPGVRYELPQVQTTRHEAFLRGLGQGATLGFGDEIAGVRDGILAAAKGGSYADGYDRSVDMSRAELGADDSDHFGLSLAGNLAGGLALPIGLEKFGVTSSIRAVGAAARDAAIAEGMAPAAADKIAARAISHRLAAEGAAYGGVSGIGSADGGPGQRLLGGAAGAAGGAALGRYGIPALERVAGGIGRGVRGAWDAATGSVTRNGAERKASGILTGNSLRPIEDIVNDIANRPEAVPGSAPTLAEVAGDAGLAGLQRGVANSDGRAGATIGERHTQNAMARTAYADEALGAGNPQDIQDLAQGRVAAAEGATAMQQAERAVAAEQRLATNLSDARTVRSGAEADVGAARTAIGPEADRAEGGAATREVFDARYEAAKRRTREAYAHPALKAEQPLGGVPQQLVANGLADAEGNLVPHYHGTAADFDRFDHAYGGSQSEYPGADEAFWFSGNDSLPSVYADRAAEKADPYGYDDVQGRVLKAGLDLRNPLVLGDAKTSNAPAGMFDELAGDDVTALRWAKRNGHDGVIWPHGNQTDAERTVAVFDPDSIKIGGGTVAKTGDGIPRSVFQNILADAHEFYGNGGGDMPAELQTILSDAADKPTTTRTLTNLDQRLADFAGAQRVAGRGKAAAFAESVRNQLDRFAQQAASPEYRAALANAKAIRAEQGRTFEQGFVGRTFGDKRFGEPNVPDSDLAARVAQPGPAGGSATEQLIAALGPEAAEGAVRQELRRAVDEGGITSERQARSLATRFGEAAKRFPSLRSDLDALVNHTGRLDAATSAQRDAERATTTVAERAHINELSAAETAIKASPLSRIADASVDPATFVAGLLRRSDGGRMLSRLASDVADKPEAAAGIRRSMGQYIVDAGSGVRNTAAGDDIPALAKTRKAISTIITRSGDLLTPQQKIALQRVGRELKATNFAMNAGRPSGSDTAQNQSYKAALHFLPLGPHARAAKAVYSALTGVFTNREQVQHLITQAILDPDFAATLLKRPTAAHLDAARARLLGRKALISSTLIAQAPEQAATRRIAGN